MNIEIIIGISALIVSIVAIGISIWAIISGKKSSDESRKEIKKMHEERTAQAERTHVEQLKQNALIANEQSRRQKIIEHNKKVREYNKNANSARMIKSEIPEDW